MADGPHRPVEGGRRCLACGVEQAAQPQTVVRIDGREVFRAVRAQALMSNRYNRGNDDG